MLKVLASLVMFIAHLVVQKRQTQIFAAIPGCVVVYFTISMLPAKATRLWHPLLREAQGINLRRPVVAMDHIEAQEMETPGW